MSNFKVISLLTAVLFAVSCSDDSYRGSDAMPADYYEQIPVNVGLGQTSMVLKSSGAIEQDDSSAFDGKSLYVYAFSTLPGTDYTVTSADGRTDCLVDASKDSTGAVSGKHGVISNRYGYALWTGSNVPFYPVGDHRNDTYRFFAYYIDDAIPAQGNYSRTRDGVTLDIDFDGSMDLMSAVAAYSYPEQPERKVSDFSYMTAKAGIMPVFQLKHRLVRMDFEFVAAVTEGVSKDILIDAVSVNSISHGTMTIAHRDTSELGMSFSTDENARRYLEVKEPGGEPLKKDYYRIHTRASESSPEQKMIVGGGLLVAPDRFYAMKIGMSEMRDGKVISSGTTPPAKIEFRNSGGEEGFEPGCRYRITVKVYGYMDIEISAELEKWNEVGTITLDEES